MRQDVSVSSADTLEMKGSSVLSYLAKCHSSLMQEVKAGC